MAYPDTCVGTDSHTTMVNGLGVLGWGVGGIEAEAAMLGQPVSMLIPRVVGFKLTGELPAGATATDLVLMITEMLRKHGVVGKFVEFYGPGVAAVPLANRATIGNMSPEYGSTAAIFPIDDETLATCASPAAPTSRSRWSRLTPRSRDCGTTRPSSRRSPRPRTRPGHGRAVDRRAEAPAGPGRAGRGQGRVPQHARQTTSRATRQQDSELDESVDETFPASDPGAVSNGHAADVHQVHSAAAHATGARATRRR